jgi:hypothetical protein
MGSINSATSYLQPILSAALQNAGLTGTTSGNSASRIDTPSIGPRTDTPQLSPFAQMMSELQQLQQTDPAKYKDVTGQIATNLQTASQTAQQDGNSTAATKLTQLATDFTNASQSGQLPSIKDLATALGGHHRHHHAHAAADPDPNSTTSATSSPSQALRELLSAFQSSTAQNTATDPMSIIMSTLSNAGLSTTGA